MSTVTIVGTEDGYNALYINGKLKYQGHSLNAYEVLRTLANSRRRVDKFETFEVDEDWMETEAGCSFPDKFKDVRVVSK